MIPLFLNSVVFILSVLLFCRYHPEIAKQFSRRKLILIVLLAFIPLLSYNPNSVLVSLILAVSIIFFLIKPHSFYLRVLLGCLGLSLFIFNTLLLSKLLTISPNLSFDWERTVFRNVYLTDTMNLAIADFRQASPFTPLFTSLIYNKTLFLFYFLQNLFHFLNLKNFYDLLFIANLYPLFWGIYHYFKEDFPSSKLFAVWLGLFLLLIGFDRTAEQTTVLYTALPLLLFFILRGLPKVNIPLFL